MITYSVTLVVSLVVAALVTWAVRNVAVARSWLDRNTSTRKVHASPVPRLGGIGIVSGFFAPLAALMLVDSSVGSMYLAQTQLVWGLFAGGAAIAALGLYDDVKGAGARQKFVVQFSVAGALYLLGFRIEVLANPFGGEFVLGPLALPFTLLWIVGVINAMNLIDGLDGLAGGIALFAVGTNFVLALARGDIIVSLMMAALAGAVLGFLIFNFNPASIFMGDTGSMFLGFVLAAVSIKTASKGGTAVAMAVPVIALGLPIMDTLLAIARRTLLGRPIFSADREHIHHRLMDRMVLSHRAAVLVMYGLTCLFTLVALGLAFANGYQAAVLLAAAALIVAVLMRKLGYLSLEQTRALQRLRRRNLELRALVRQATASLETARHLEDIWSALRPIGALLKAQEIQLGLDHGGPQEGVFSERMVEPSAAAEPLHLRIDVVHRNEPHGRLQITWADGRKRIDRDEELALEVMADAIARAAVRVRPTGARFRSRPSA